MKCQYDLTFVVIGELGVGKTITLVALAVRHIIKFSAKRPIYANFHLKVDYINQLLIFLGYPQLAGKWKFHYIATPKEFEDVRDGFCALDEAFVWADSRLSMKKSNLFTSQIILKSRKRDMDIVFSAQMLGMLDRRIRKICDLIAVPRMNERSKVVHVSILANHSYQPIKFFKFYAPQYYGCYDTNEEIQILQEDEE